MPKTVLKVLLLLVTAAVTGCLGSPEPFRPIQGEKRPLERVETAEARAERLAIPVHILREEARLVQTKKEIARIMGDTPRNPWNDYEWDLEDSLGRPITVKVLGRNPVARPKIDDGTPPKKKKAEGEGDSGDDDDDDDDDE